MDCGFCLSGMKVVVFFSAVVLLIYVACQIYLKVLSKENVQHCSDAKGTAVLCAGMGISFPLRSMRFTLVLN